MCITLFLHFYAVVARTRRETSQISRFVEVNNDDLLLLFLNLNTVLYHIAQKNSLTFDKLNDIKKSDEY